MMGKVSVARIIEKDEDDVGTIQSRTSGSLGGLGGAKHSCGDTQQ